MCGGYTFISMLHTRFEKKVLQQQDNTHEHRAWDMQRRKPRAECTTVSFYCSCRASKALEAILRPTGLLKLAEALEEKVWVTITIAVLISLAAAAPYFPGKCCLSHER